MHQNSPDVLGVAEPTDRFGSTVGVVQLPAGCDDCATRPGLVVASRNEGADAEQGSAAAIQTFRHYFDPGGLDSWITAGAYGVPADAQLTAAYVTSYDGSRVYGVPWSNIEGTTNDPATIYAP
ncbi:MAG: hypothetical protein ACRDTM_04085 [Micromonosporaceae bacterium]